MVLQAGMGAALVALTRAPLGLHPPRLWAGLRCGAAVAGCAAGAVAATTLVPAVRESMAGREPPARRRTGCCCAYRWAPSGRKRPPFARR
ncbi:caax amino protease family protein [Mycobacterium avium subsp. avium 2285 (R)]|nr:caax amino protease family protein [Mycobacterium avium subsp. avium 2285 (R)]